MVTAVVNVNASTPVELARQLQLLPSKIPDTVISRIVQQRSQQLFVDKDDLVRRVNAGRANSRDGIGPKVLRWLRVEAPAGNCCCSRHLPREHLLSISRTHLTSALCQVDTPSAS